VFVGPAPPPSPVEGQVWADSSAPLPPGPQGLLARAIQSDQATRTATSFAAAVDFAQTPAVACQAGRIYRVRAFTANCGFTANAAPQQILWMAVARAGVQLSFATAVTATTIDQRWNLWAEWTGTMAAGSYQFSARFWATGGTYRPDFTGAGSQGVVVTVEDLGPSPGGASFP
jgi:hypothetical protein